VHISVIGTGYLGATHAACLASGGHVVTGVDSDPARVHHLSGGRAPFHEPDLDPLLREGLAARRLRFDTDLDAVAGADVHFLCVGTPQGAVGRATDLGDLEAAVDALAPMLQDRCLVVGKSTVPVGTARRIRRRLRERSPAGEAVSLAWNPEFLREGRAVADSLRPDRIVLGVEDDADDLLLREVYAPQLGAGVPVVRTDLETAELAKVAANSMLAARISMVNLLAEVCEASGADVSDLVRVLGMDERIGPSFLVPGIGYGGGCLPKDTRGFAARAEELGVGASAALLHEVDAVNLRQRTRTVELAARMAGGGLEGTRVGVLGAAFKAGSDDLRDSPALDIARRVEAAGAEVRIHDPLATEPLGRLRPPMAVADSVEDACRDADVVLVLTGCEEFGAVDPVALADVVRHPRIIDGRLVLDAEKWRAAGWLVHAHGRGTTR
jgi:UDPglucose 6-dehydrogenase